MHAACVAERAANDAEAWNRARNNNTYIVLNDAKAAAERLN